MIFPIVEVCNNNFTVRRATKTDIAEIVYALIQLIPIGYVTTYSDIANTIGVSPRYVANILKENKNPIAIPCHRVIKSGGKIGGYTLNGKRADQFKEKLLMLESLGKSPYRIRIDILIFMNSSKDTTYSQR